MKAKASLGRIISRPLFCSPSVGGGGARSPGVAAVPEPLRRQISFFPGDDEGVFCILSGGSFVRFVCLSCAGGFLLFLLFDFDRMVGATNNPLRLLFLLLLAAVGSEAERSASDHSIRRRMGPFMGFGYWAAVFLICVAGFVLRFGCSGGDPGRWRISRS